MKRYKWFLLGEWIKQHWYLPVSVFFVVVGGLLFFIFSAKGCASSTDTEQTQILEQVNQANIEAQKRIEELDAAIFALQEQINALDEQIQASAVEREKTHEAINKARTIRAVDAVLRKGKSPAANSTGFNSAAGRIYPNPYD